MTTPDPERPATGAGADDATSTYDPVPVSPPVPTAAPVPPPPGGTPPAGAVPSLGGVPPSATPPSWAPAQPAAAQPSTPSTSSTPGGLVLGVILVVVGGALLIGRVVDISLAGVTWPVWIVVPGVAMLVGSFFIPARGGVGLAAAGAIVTTVGLILWVQDAYDLYATWAYAWALVAPTAPGIGMALYGVVHRDGKLVGDGARTMLVGLGLFLGFALFFEGVIGLSGTPIANLDEVLPYAIVGLGILLVVLSFFGRRDETARTAR